jgi:hypothetical protein
MTGTWRVELPFSDEGSEGGGEQNGSDGSGVRQTANEWPFSQ